MPAKPSRRLLGAGLALLVLVLLALPKLLPKKSGGPGGAGGSAASGSSAGGRSAGGGPAGGGGGGPGAPAALPYALPRSGNIEQDIEVTGTLRPWEEVELKTETAGRVVSLPFQEGSAVKKGALLLKLDDAELRARLEQARQRRLLAADNEKRMRRQLEIEAVSRLEYDQAQSELRVQEAEEKLLLAQLRKTEIRAPFGGVLGLRQLSPGSAVSAGTPITTLQDLSSLKLDFSIPENQAALLGPGQRVEFLPAGATAWREAEIVALEPGIEARTRSRPARAKVPGPGSAGRERGGAAGPGDSLAPAPPKALSGGFARVRLRIPPGAPALLVPLRALSADARGSRVWVSRGGKAESRAVGTGARDEEWVEVTAGLTAADTVLVGGAALKPGAPVRLGGPFGAAAGGGSAGGNPRDGGPGPAAPGGPARGAEGGAAAPGAAR